jgi:hypothetical protein
MASATASVKTFLAANISFAIFALVIFSPARSS